MQDIVVGDGVLNGNRALWRIWALQTERADNFGGRGISEIDNSGTMCKRRNSRGFNQSNACWLWPQKSKRLNGVNQFERKKSERFTATENPQRLGGVRWSDLKTGEFLL